MKGKHRSLGDVRGIGLFWALELVKNRETREPLVKWNAMGAEGAVAREINKRLLEGGVYTTVRWNYLLGGIPLTQVTPIYRIMGYGRLPQEPY